MEKLLNIMALLRDKKFGCPWDLEQTHSSLVKYTLEEVYEVVDAVENGTVDQLKDELGDLLFQVVFYAQISRENGEFDFADVAEAISDKLVRRHPHVFPDGMVENFGQQQSLTADDVVVNWEAIKDQERKAKGITNDDQDWVSILEDVPVALPATVRALKLQKRAASVGFDWEKPDPVFAKLKEEIIELEEAVSNKNRKAVSEEIGDLFFAVVNLARHLDIEPETALREANKKFETRFRYVEEQLKTQDRQVQDIDLAELDQIWDQAKQKGL